jgi:hypothetical protein
MARKGLAVAVFHRIGKGRDEGGGGNHRDKCQGNQKIVHLEPLLPNSALIVSRNASESNHSKRLWISLVMLLCMLFEE